ncbi:hypothetical protein DRQ07_11420 [candidate division KSB1 bacterium]|nr:MAG: hypothetical protein DRQ07_11420 [candidate division KSB1 bacterium]
MNNADTVGAGYVPRVTVVIPHWKGEDILRHTLKFLFRTDYNNFSVIVVNNDSPDGSIDKVMPDFPQAKIVNAPKNLGFAAGCNLGIKHADSEYIVLLNNDTEVDSNWLLNLVSVISSDTSVAAVQVKLLNYFKREFFDYSGAAGGLIDIFGYPFAMGRVFDYMEQDEGQYDSVKDVFWASGAAVILRKSALDKTGLLDEMFFAHMEEIDLEWRFQLNGYKVMTCPDALVYHRSGATLQKENLMKMRLNHRNNIIMLLKNYGTLTLLWVLPLRIMFEIITVVFGIITLQPGRSAAVILSFIDVIINLPLILRKRRIVQNKRIISDSEIMKKMFRGSIVFEYFIKRKKTAAQIL